MNEPLHDIHNQLPPPIVLIGEGLADMTPDRFDMLGRMVYGLGLVASRGGEADTNNLEQDAHTIARELFQVQQASDVLHDLVRSQTTDSGKRKYEQAVNRLVAPALWNRIDKGVQANPVLMHEVALCLAAGEDREQRILAGMVASKVFNTHLERDALDAATSVSDLFVRLAVDDPDDTVKGETREYLADIVFDLDARISGGSSELQPLLNKLWQAQGYIVSVVNDPARPAQG